MGNGRVSRYMLEKACILVNRPMRAVLVRTQKEEESYRENLHLLDKYLSNCEQNVGRSVDGKNHSDEVLDRNEEHVIRNWRKNGFYKVLKKLPESCLCFSILWKVEF